MSAGSTLVHSRSGSAAAEFSLAQVCAAVTDTSLAPESGAAVSRPQVYPVNGQDVVAGDDRAVGRVHVNVVRREPQFREEAQK